MSEDRPQNQRTTQDRESLFRAIIEQTAVAVFVKDLEGRYVFVNPAIAVMFEQPAEAMLGKNDAALFPPAVAQRLRGADREVLESGETGSFEEAVIIEGVHRTFLSAKTPWRDAQGNILGIIGIAHDVTERKQSAEALEAKVRELDSANRIMMDREQRIVELKEQVKALGARLSARPPYST